MAAADLFLRSKPKLRATDLWLHPAGADGGVLPSISDSGTIVGVAALAGREVITDAGAYVGAAALTGGEAVAEQNVLVAIAAFSASEALADAGTIDGVAVLTGERVRPAPTLPAFGVTVDTTRAQAGPDTSRAAVGVETSRGTAAPDTSSGRFD